MSTDFVKQTLRENLARTVIPHVADGLWSIYDNAKKAAERNNQPDQILRTFQNLLTQIPKWSTETLKKEVERISVASKCDYIEDLLLGVFVSYIRAFASLQKVDTSTVEIPFTRPSVETFIHAFYKQSARACWSNAYLFKTVGVAAEQQARNRREIENMIGAALNEVIDSFIPWKDISKAYFHGKDIPVAEAPVVPEPEPVPEPAPAPAPAPAVKFEDEDDEEDAQPTISLGDDVSLDADDFESETEDEGEVELKPSSEVSLNM
jgi:hypothetical protein